MCIYKPYILTGMQLLPSFFFGLWPFERLLRLDWHGRGVGREFSLGTGRKPPWDDGK